jgi:hypothetical protein
MTEVVPPSKVAMREALSLSEEALRNIELSEIPLARVALKLSRLARLLNDFEHQRIMEFEAGGYPTAPTGVPPEVYVLAVKAGREYQLKDTKKGTIENYIYATPIEELELEASSAQVALAAARDPDVSVSSSNPNQFVWNPSGNSLERNTIRTSAATAQRRLSSRRSFLYAYALKKNYELKFSGIADDIFSRIRKQVDDRIGERVPTAVQKLAAVYDNLTSDNAEDWSNAVHSCRRILQDLADSLFPPREDVVVQHNGKPKTIKLGADNYVNRIMAFLEEHSDSERFREIVGSHISYVGERLDSVFRAAQKGSHASVTREEADRYVVYTYLVVGDVLSLL